MQHHRHPGRAGRLSDEGSELLAHPDTENADACLVWFAVTDQQERTVEALEALLCVPTRAGAMRLAAVPHVMEGLTLGDEVAVGEWQGAPLARGELALALAGTIRVVGAASRDWRWIAASIQQASATPDTCWFDVISDHALAASVPRTSLPGVCAALTTAAAADDLRWEYVTSTRHRPGREGLGGGSDE